MALLKKPDATEHSLIIENDESVFDARVVTFFQECRLLWAPGNSAGDGNIVPYWQKLLNWGHLWSLKNLGSAFATVGAQYQILSSDVCWFGYTASVKLGAFSFLVWWGVFFQSSEVSEKWEKRMEQVQIKDKWQR